MTWAKPISTWSPAPGLVQGEARDPNQTSEGQRDSIQGLLLLVREMDSPFSSTMT